MEITQAIDTKEGIEKRRPYLDQMTLPLPIQEAGLTGNLLAKELHFILGGKVQGKPFPKEREILSTTGGGLYCKKTTWRALPSGGWAITRVRDG